MTDAVIELYLFCATCVVPNVLFFALKYPDDFEKALLASTNIGGDTCGRNAILGAVMGAGTCKLSVIRCLM